MKQKLNICFIFSKRYSFYPPDYSGRGLGGTESMLVLVSTKLAELGHNVTVFNCCYKEGSYKKVKWLSLWKLNKDFKFDVLIAVRWLSIFDNLEFTAKINGVWIHDSTLSGFRKYVQTKKLNLLLTLSKTQTKNIFSDGKGKSNLLFETRNGYDENIYTSELANLQKIENQVIYCSAPDRGLKYLLEYWSYLQEGIPNISLIITGSFALWGNTDEENELIFSDLYKKAKSYTNIKVIQRCSKLELAKLQATSKLMLYPTDFDEMYCISVLECMRVGTPVITSRRAALTERINHGEDGILINGNPMDKKYFLKFIEATEKVLKNEALWKTLSKNAMANTSELNILNLAKEWEDKFLTTLNTK